MELAGPSRPSVVSRRTSPSSSVPASDTVATRWSSSLPSWPSPVARLTCRAFPCRPYQTNRGRSVGPALYTFASPSECDSSRAGCLEPTSLPVMTASSHGIRVAPSPTSLYSRPLPPSPKEWLRPAATTPPVPFRPRGSSPPRRFPPRASRESVAPHSRPEVRCVSLPRPPNHQPKPTIRTPRDLPATRFTPLEGFPSPAAAPCHHGRCPLDVAAPSPLRRAAPGSRSRPTLNTPPPRRSIAFAVVVPVRPAVAAPPPPPVARVRLQRVSASAVAFKALLRRRVRTVVQPLPADSTAYPSMGFVPLQGPNTFRLRPASGKHRAAFAGSAPGGRPAASCGVGRLRNPPGGSPGLQHRERYRQAPPRSVRMAWSQAEACGPSWGF